MVSGIAADQQKSAESMSNGIVGQALINQIADTGTTVNEIRRCNST
jgi:hypothetical protein